MIRIPLGSDISVYRDRFEEIKENVSPDNFHKNKDSVREFMERVRYEKNALRRDWLRNMEDSYREKMKNFREFSRKVRDFYFDGMRENLKIRRERAADRVEIVL